MNLVFKDLLKGGLKGGLKTSLKATFTGRGKTALNPHKHSSQELFKGSFISEVGQ